MTGESCSKQCLYYNTVGLKMINLVNHSSYMWIYTFWWTGSYIYHYSHTARLLTMSMKCGPVCSLFWLWIAHTGRKSASDRHEKWSITVFTSAELPLSESQTQAVVIQLGTFCPLIFESYVHWPTTLSGTPVQLLINTNIKSANHRAATQCI